MFSSEYLLAFQSFIFILKKSNEENTKASTEV